jgi:hypothetical protein
LIHGKQFNVSGEPVIDTGVREALHLAQVSQPNDRTLHLVISRVVVTLRCAILAFKPAQQTSERRSQAAYDAIHPPSGSR